MLCDTKKALALKTPILFLIFNRPDTTQKVFEQIAKQKPERLYIAADGPRDLKKGELQLCEAARKIVESITWPCEVKRLYRENNLGCKIAVCSAITWFFENEEEGIILEDDCLPHPDFFSFCGNALETYRDQYLVMHINGYNPLENQNESRFSNYISIWGWATWRRAWNLYQPTAEYYKSFQKQQLIRQIFPKNYYLVEPFIDDVIKGKYNTWDLQWAIALHVYFAMSILPSKNLIQNIGFDGNSTHTNELDASKLGIAISEKSHIIKLPKNMEVNVNLDDELVGYFNGKYSFLKLLIFIKYRLKSVKP